MQYIDNILFLILIIVGFGLFFKSLKELTRNVNLGKDIDRSDNKNERWAVMGRVALGQGKMVKRPVAGILHILVYLGFIIVNLELAEIFIDGLFGTHRFLAGVLGLGFYNVFTAVLEVMAFLVAVSIAIFFIRRNIIHIRRLNMKELLGWPKNDANWILVIEFSLMMAFFLMNSSDLVLMTREGDVKGYFPFSQSLFGVFNGFGDTTLHILEKGAWWFHIIGVFFFMNYLYYSKHLHIIFAFPNTWFANLQKKGKFNNLTSVTKEIKLMMDPNADPYAAAPADADPNAVPDKFGANDVFDLNKVQLLNAYSCTECGRCTAVCPANITGKKLSPRRIMMATRDRLEEVGKNINKNGKFVDDGKKLLDDYISREELWACTTCNACVEACPVLIDPLSIIFEMRRFMVMEQSSAPQELNLMMTNIENNAAPWQYNQADRLNWANES
ncbi:4Fe-4S dicluster domain-containing protein [Elizabethkingia anophelis]|uniref:(Fe-S)-binding protein n=1 Tax=Elizabethkingia anophelis TaxID=1117645 RepID=UPI002012235F|nr:(Fe-S)-binding protein [Elizabethkingia anophelis]EJC8059444.1 (Fe-S)-binding protein [Elizabethkingia anophelis]MCL1641901.1 (Fe-S)-binding protein [Elizabethkingia anophelis]MCL1644446.1 (Fe-S)-binding protein [Elizabethkingia anophelis]MCT3926096.1 (Fe-S)-binding protein [Elizabethkingia anophelis]MCT4032159.1 (Fe-S)-binding protein [Elizabethkingia anophelis]